MNSLGTSTSGTVASEDSVVPAYQCTDAKSMPVDPHAPGSTMLFQFVYSVSEWATTMPPILIVESTAFIAVAYCLTAAPLELPVPAPPFVPAAPLELPVPARPAP